MTTAVGPASIEEIRTCRSCGSGDLSTVFDLGRQPFANTLLDAADAGEHAYPLVMVICGDCGLVQLRHTADPAALFSHYVWVTGTSSTARAQSTRFRDDALMRCGPGTKPRFVVEIASNDGTFLRPFLSQGLAVLGIDPAANVAAQANAAGVPTKCAFFSNSIAQDVVKERGVADIVIARNVLAHVADLHSFVEGIATLIGATGLAAIEFHYGRKILDQLQYDSIYHEHLCYITASSVQRLLARCGLEIVDLTEGPISGGALVVYARARGTGSSTPAVDAYLKAEAEAQVTRVEAWQEFGRRAEAHRSDLRALLQAEVAAGRRVAGYGASARSSTLLNYCGIDSRLLFAIADANPMKHGRYTAGTRIPIAAPEAVMSERPDTILMLAWNFRAELMDILSKRLEFRGRVIVPLPSSPVIELLS